MWCAVLLMGFGIAGLTGCGKLAEELADAPSGDDDRLERILRPQTIDETRACVRFLGFALAEYRRNNGDVPTDEEGLSALVIPPRRHAATWGLYDLGKNYAPPGMLDMWGREYYYKRIDSSAGLPFVVRSLGPDGVLSADDIEHDSAVWSVYSELNGLSSQGHRYPDPFVGAESTPAHPETHAEHGAHEGHGEDPDRIDGVAPAPPPHVEPR